MTKNLPAYTMHCNLDCAGHVEMGFVQHDNIPWEQAGMLPLKAITENPKGSTAALYDVKNFK
jgi:hypothetical protein